MASNNYWMMYACQMQCKYAVINAQNENRSYSPYYAGFPDPRRHPYVG